MIVYHKVDDYWGVLVEGHSVFSGSYAACIDYLRLMTSHVTMKTTQQRRFQYGN